MKKWKLRKKEEEICGNGEKVVEDSKDEKGGKVDQTKYQNTDIEKTEWEFKGIL